jgi:predicted nucleic acid-binding protein
MESEVLVDSNVFIDLMKHRGDPAPWLYRWAGIRNLAICGMVRVEVLRGVKSPKAYRSLNDFMDVMVNIPSSNRLWDEAAALARKLDRKGLVIPGTDVVIAASAITIGAAVLTSDAHFGRIEGLRVLAPPGEWFA